MSAKNPERYSVSEPVKVDRKGRVPRVTGDAGARCANKPFQGRNSVVRVTFVPVNGMGVSLLGYSHTGAFEWRPGDDDPRVSAGAPMLARIRRASDQRPLVTGTFPES
jgi:hypothetical protein